MQANKYRIKIKAHHTKKVYYGKIPVKINKSIDQYFIQAYLNTRRKKFIIDAHSYSL
jgi:hypothetical protein